MTKPKPKFAHLFESATPPSKGDRALCGEIAPAKPVPHTDAPKCPDCLAIEVAWNEAFAVQEAQREAQHRARLRAADAARVKAACIAREKRHGDALNWLLTRTNA